MTVDELEVTTASLSRVFQDGSASTGQFTFAVAKLNAALTSQKVELVQGGYRFVFNKAVPMAPSVEFLGRNADGAKWMFKVAWKQLFPDTTTEEALISGLV